MKQKTKTMIIVLITGPISFLVTEFLRKSTELKTIESGWVISLLLFSVVLLISTITLLVLSLGEKHE